MGVGFGRSRKSIPPSNLGVNVTASRRVAEAAGRAAERTSIAVSVDAFPSRIWLRNPRGTIACLCSSAALSRKSTPLTPEGGATIHLPHGEGDDLNAPDSGYPLEGPPATPGLQLPAEAPRGDVDNWVDAIGRMLMGNGRRCGLCWGTGWIDGHRLWGGARVLCCAVSSLYATIDSTSDVDVDLDSPTPTMIGPGTVTWDLDIPASLNIIDALRVRDGLRPAHGSWQLLVKMAGSSTYVDAATALGLDVGLATQKLQGSITAIQLVLEDGAQVSHVELVLRSEPLVNLQLPNLQMQASAELVAPFQTEEFELDPAVGWIERGTILEVPGFGGRLGSVWLITDVNINRTAQGVIWNVLGNARNVQPNEVIAAASMDDALSIGILDPGLTARGFENTGAGVPAGLPDGQTDSTVGAVKRGQARRVGGGTGPAKTATIVISSHIEGD